MIYPNSIFDETTMLTKTSEIAIQALVYLALRQGDEPIPPRQIAGALGASPSYMAKVCGSLVKANILRAIRGVKGGVAIARSPREITLLEVVEACQGMVLGDYCQDHPDPEPLCAYHQAMGELHQATLSVLKRWTLADLAAKPQPAPSLRETVSCRLECVCRTLKRADEPAE